MILHIASYRDVLCVYHEQCIFPQYGITQYTKIRLQEYDRIYAIIWYMITNRVDSDNKRKRSPAGTPLRGGVRRGRSAHRPNS